MPYPRHRWALAAMLGLDETISRPQLRSARSRPGDVQAVYPILDAVPEDVWLRHSAPLNGILAYLPRLLIPSSLTRALWRCWPEGGVRHSRADLPARSGIGA